MLDTNFTKFNPEKLYSFFPKNKRLKLSKQGINLFSNANMLNNPQNNNFIIINGLNATNNKGINQIKNFNSTNYKWNYNYAINSNLNSNLVDQKFNGFVSSTGTSFYKGKITQSSYGRKYRVNNGYKLKGNSQKKNLKINSKNNLVENKIPERVKSVRGGNPPEGKNTFDNRLIERIFNQYESNMKKVLYEMGVTGNIKEKISTPLSRSNNNNIKSFNTKNSIKNMSDKNNNLPFLSNQNQPDGNKMNLQKPKKIYGYSNLNPSSETNIININNFINFYSDTNNITYNRDNQNNNNINLINNNHINNIYGTLTNTTLNNNLATNSTNSNIGNNNIIFGTSNISKKNSFNNFSFNANNFKGKSRSINSINNTFRSDLRKKNSGEANLVAIDNIWNVDANIKKKNVNNINNNNDINVSPFIDFNQKKTRAASTVPHQFKINLIKDKSNNKDIIAIKKEINNNMNNNQINAMLEGI